MDQKLKQDLRIGPNIRKYRMQSHLTQDQEIFNINYESFFDGIMLNHRDKQ